MLENLKIELVTILPQIKEASAKNYEKNKKDEKKLKKMEKKFIGIITNTKVDVLSFFYDDELGFTFETVERLNDVVQEIINGTSGQ